MTNMNNIRKLMKERGLTQAQLAKLANISQASLSDIINSKVQAKAETLASLASALEVSEAELQRRPSSSIDVCPRCGSNSLIIWQSTAEHHARVRCSYCELDTGEQKSMEKVTAILQSYEHNKAQDSYTQRIKVLTLSELLEDKEYSSDSVRPVWFENRGLFVVPALLQCGIAERENELCRVQWLGETGLRSFLWEKYGLYWRAWNNKPTEGIIDATPWDD